MGRGRNDDERGELDSVSVGWEGGCKTDALISSCYPFCGIYGDVYVNTTSGIQGRREDGGGV